MHASFPATRSAVTWSPREEAGHRHRRGWVAAATGVFLVASLLPIAVLAVGTFSISGSVRNASAAVVPGIRVSACHTAADGSEACSTAATTATDGTWTVTGLAPGDYAVKLEDPAHAYPNGWYAIDGFTVDSGAATQVAVTATDVTGRDATYPTVYRMSGKVTDASGTPVVSADVDPCLADAIGACDLVTTTGAGGRFSIPVVAGGYEVTLYDHSPTHQRFFSQRYGEVSATGSSATVIPVAADVTGLDLRLQPAARVSGRFRVSAPGGGVFGCPSPIGPEGSCHGVSFDEARPFDYTIAVVPGRVVITARGGAGAGSLPGYWTKAGLVADRAHATVIDVSHADARGIDITPVVMAIGIRRGSTGSGSFGSMPVTVVRGASVTVRVILGRGYAGERVQVQAAALNAGGLPGTFRTVATRTVGADGTFRYTTSPGTSTAFRARYVWTADLTITVVVSAVVTARVR